MEKNVIDKIEDREYLKLENIIAQLKQDYRNQEEIITQLRADLDAVAHGEKTFCGVCYTIIESLDDGPPGWAPTCVDCYADAIDRGYDSEGPYRI